MKKIFYVTSIVGVTVLLQFCNSSKKATKIPSPPPPPIEEIVAKPVDAIPSGSVSYIKDIAPLMKASCAPCHFPPNGNKDPLDTYETVKESVSSVLYRVKLAHDARGFMPFMNKKPALSDSAIKVIEAWKKEGMPQ